MLPIFWLVMLAQPAHTKFWWTEIGVWLAEKMIQKNFMGEVSKMLVPVSGENVS